MTTKNYLIQSNFFNNSIFNPYTDIQKELVYLIQETVDFYTDNPPEEIKIDYDRFLGLKNAKKNNTLTPEEILKTLKELGSTSGIIYNQIQERIELYNLLDTVSVDVANANHFNVKLASWGKIFFFQKEAQKYAQQLNVSYTQLSKHIIDLEGTKRKRFYELLSQFKTTGQYMVSLKDFRLLLGFDVYDTPNEIQSFIDFPSVSKTDNHLSLFFKNKKPEKQFFTSWKSLKNDFLDKAIETINNNKLLDIKNLSYTVTKNGTRVAGLIFTFNSVSQEQKLSSVESTFLNTAKSYGLDKNQALYLLRKLDINEINRRLNHYLTFNPNYDKKDSINYRRNIWFTNPNKSNTPSQEIGNIGGFMYSTVFPELKKPSLDFPSDE